MRFSFAHIPADPVESRPEFVAFGEGLGFDGAWIPDQTLFGDPYAVLGACAMTTKRIGLGIGITNPFTRHPVVTVRAAATVDGLSGGRVRLGIGAGNQRELIAPLGLDGSHAATASVELVRVARRLLSGERLSHDGTTLRLHGVQLEFSTRAGLPIYIAGRGPAILRAAGRVADGVVLSIAGFERAEAIVGEGLTSVGRTIDSLDVVLWGECVPTEMPGVDVERSRVRLGHVLGRAPEEGLKVMGLDEATIRRIKAAYATSGPEGASVFVTDEIMRRHVIIGTAEECRAQLRRYATLGAQEFSYLIPPAPLDKQRQRLSWFAEHVMAPLREEVSRG
ncbi:MAG: LLM class flavin-dependent oxidoreductase [Armatimonadota bacterium]